MLQYLLWWFRGVVISSGFILCWNWWLVELSAALFAQSYVMDSSKASPRADGPAVAHEDDKGKKQRDGRDEPLPDASTLITAIKAEYEGKLVDMQSACDKQVAVIKQGCAGKIAAMAEQHKSSLQQQKQVYHIKWQKCLKAAEQGAVAARNAGYDQGYAAGYEAGLMQQGKATSSPAAVLASSLRQSPHAVPQHFSTEATAAVGQPDSNNSNSWSSGSLVRSICGGGSLQLAVGEEAGKPDNRGSTGGVLHNTNSIPLPVSLLCVRKAAVTAVTTAPSATASLDGSANEDAICFLSVITAAGKADSSKAVSSRVAGQQAVGSAPGNHTVGRECFKWQLPATASTGNKLGGTGGLFSNSVGASAQWGGDLLGASKSMGSAGQLGAGLFGSTNSIRPAGYGLVGVDKSAAWAANTLQDSKQPHSSAPALSCPGLFTAGDMPHSIWGPDQPAGAGWTASAGWDSKGDPITLGATSAPAREPQETVQQGSSVQGIAVGSGMQHALWGPVPAQSAGAGLAGFALAGGSVMGWPGGQQGQLPGGLWDMWDAQEGFADGGVVGT